MKTIKFYLSFYKLCPNKMTHYQFPIGISNHFHLSHVMRKPVLVIYEQRRCRSAAHPRSLISTFVVRYLDSIIHILAKSKISRLKLSSVAAQVGLSRTWSETRKTYFLATRLMLGVV